MLAVSMFVWLTRSTKKMATTPLELLPSLEDVPGQSDISVSETLSSKLRSKLVKDHSSRSFKMLRETDDNDSREESLSPLLDPRANEDTQEVVFDERLQPFRPRLIRSRSATIARRLKAIEPAPEIFSEMDTETKKKKSFSTEEALKLMEKRREDSSRPNLLVFRHFFDSDKFPKGIIPENIILADRF
mmetsp:Transcript_12941/g.19652  ORF Transcript_12941/g.19652 Transcript_12941/m.19652 type:complete len:188 (+) Transcript_12941:164-727(+)